MTDIEANKWEPQRKNASTKQLSKVEVERSKSQAASLERRSKLSAAFGGKIKDVHHRDKVWRVAVARGFITDNDDKPMPDCCVGYDCARCCLRNRNFPPKTTRRKR